MGGFGSRGGMCLKAPLKSRSNGVAACVESAEALKTSNKDKLVEGATNKLKNTSRKRC